MVYGGFLAGIIVFLVVSKFSSSFLVFGDV